MYLALRTIIPPAAEPIPIDLARRHCRVDADYDDDLLAIYLGSARQWAEAWLNRALMTQTLRLDLTSAPPSLVSPIMPQSLIVLPLDYTLLLRSRAIELLRSPVQSIQSVSGGPTGEMTPVDPDDYLFNGAVEPAQLLLQPQFVTSLWSQSMSIQYVAGYADQTLIPTPICQAILLLTAFLYEQRGDAGGDMPPAAEMLMWPFRLWTFAG